MKVTIRENVWETNSSSVHAIAIPKKNIDKDQVIAYNYTIKFKHGEFGWEHDIYDDVYTKASYLYQAIFECKCPYFSPAIRQRNNKADLSEEEFKKYKKVVKEFNEKRKEFNKVINWIYEVLAKYGFNAEFDTDDYDEMGWQKGYIDHGYETVDFVDYILYNEKHLMNYLFGNAEICTSNDNSDMDDYGMFIDNHPEKDYKVFVKGN